MRKVHRDEKGEIVTKADVKAAAKMVRIGVETVAFTYILFLTQKEWPKKIKNAVTAKNAVDAARREIKPSKVVLSDELHNLLEQWAMGEMLPDKVLARQRAAQAAAAVDTEADEDNVDDQDEEVVEQLPEVTEGESVEPPVVPHAPAKRGLAARFADAKRQR